MLSEGQILEGKYRVERLLSKGGMGAVFVGHHTSIKRKVAIKVLHEGTGSTSDAMQRFEKEAQAAGQIGSDHIVEVLDLGNTPEGDRFMVMEFLDGETLTDRIKKGGRLTPVAAVPLITQLLEGLSGAHAAGIVHRDLKPDNVFILKEKAGRRDFVKIVDFGVSKFASLEGGAGGQTKDGAVMGTPYYMSPEQARSANEADARSDLYSVGVILYEAVTGMVPFQATTFTDLLFKIVFEQPPHPNQIVHDLDRDFATLIMTAMARDPAARFQTAKDLQAALDAWLATRSGGRAPNGAVATLVSHQHGPAAQGPASVSHGGGPASVGAGTAFLPQGAGGSQAMSSSQGYGSQPHPQSQPFSQNQGGQAAFAQSHGGGPVSADVQTQRNAPMHTVVGAPAGMGFDTGKAWQAANPPPSSRTGVIAVAVVAALALGGGAAFLAFSGKGKPVEAASTATPASPSTNGPTAAPQVTVAPQVTAAATAIPTVEDAPSAPTAASTAPAASAAPAAPVAPTPPSPVARPASPGPRPPATSAPTTPKPTSTVKDFGY